MLSGDRRNNSHKSLRRLAVVDAWFRRSPQAENRYTLHADVSFNEERLGGGPESDIIFRVAVRQCEIVFIRPNEGFSVDRSSVKRQPPLPPRDAAEISKKTKAAGFRATLGLSRTPAADVSGSFERSASVERKSEATYKKSSYNEQWKLSIDGYDAWRVNGAEFPSGRLSGPVFDVESEPRLTLNDVRSAARQKSDEERSLPPISRIEVRCLREDIDIFDIRFKDEEKQGLLSKLQGQSVRVAVARRLLQEALLQEGLSVGSLVDDPFAEMTICDATIPITDQSTAGGREGSDIR